VGEPTDTSVVVYLDPLEEPRTEAPQPSIVAPVRTGVYSAHVLAAARHQPVEFVVEDKILHKLFSYDEENAFELETSDGAQPSRVVFERPGLVHFYCSLHPAEGGRILVTPGPHFAYAGEGGRFRIANVPAGPYRLKTWSARTLPTERVVRLPLEEEEAPLEILLEASAGDGE